MPVLIKGMDMPKEPFTGISVLIAANGCVYRNRQYLSDVEAVELPPHGRLIDADAEIRLIEKWTDHPDPYIRKRNLEFIHFLREAETVIEAEE